MFGIGSTGKKKVDYDFKFYFNRKKQFCEVFIHDVSNETFKRRGGGRWGYFLATRGNSRIGKIGELHFVKSRLRFDTIAHELFHLMVEFAWSNGEAIDRRNEERYATFLDEITRNFLKEFKKVYGRKEVQKML